ncbi:MAG: hypothetical protein SFX72_18570 [Isosphaeraceae bacterium]|nr:hypothetical protein [Isosphaeraceae bacterium]
MAGEESRKRELRRLKREIKRAGVRRMRRRLERELTDNPEEAHLSEVDYGRLTSTEWNDLDRRSGAGDLD